MRKNIFRTFFNNRMAAVPDAAVYFSFLPLKAAEREEIMKKRKLVLALCLAGSMALQGCAGRAKVPPVQETAQTEAETSPEATEETTKEDGLQQEEPEEEYRLEDDYYEYTNHILLEDVDIPSDSNNWGYFYVLANEAYENLDAILHEVVDQKDQYEAGSEQQKIAGLYLTAMDMEGRNAAGFGQLQGYLDRIDSAAGIQEYLETLGVQANELGLCSLMALMYGVDMSDSNRYAAYLCAPDLGLGKESLEDPSMKELQQTYRTYIASVLENAGKTKEEAQQAAEAVYALQKDLAGAALSLYESSDPSKIYNVYSKEELAALFPGVDMEGVLKSYGMEGKTEFIVQEPELMKKINEYLTEDNLQMLKDYSTFCLLNDMGPYLNEDIRNDYLKFKQYRSGAESIKADDKLASEMAQSLLGFEFGKLYAKRYFSEESKHQVEDMVGQIMDAYETKIDGLDWMSPDTKEAAKKKLKHMDLKIGYPEKWPDVNERATVLLPQDGGVLVNNVLELIKAAQANQVESASKPVDRSEWLMTPQTVNAYYNPQGNEIVFPAAILQSPFFDPEAEYAENLGGIGMVIAHEITHAFDDNGAQFDENGNFNTWWTEKDYEEFHKRTQAVVEYYDGYEGFDGIHVNGAQTLGENIADLGALSCVMQLAGDNPEDLKKLCTRYAQIWASKYTDESMKMRLNTDVHSPDRVRVNAVLSSMDGFYLAYPEIEEGDGMYVAPGKRVGVW